MSRLTGPPHQRGISVSELRTAGLFILKAVLRSILRKVKNDPQIALEPTWLGKRHKKALRIDAWAEDKFGELMQTYKGGKFASIAIYGEERLDNENLDLSTQQGLMVLVDMVDGTDLLERGLSNWCSAAVFFCPTEEPTKRILAAFVGLPSGEVYYATAEDDTAYVSMGEITKPVSGPSAVKSLVKSSICFYGQKLANLRELTECRLFRYLNELDDRQRMKKQMGEPISEDEEIISRIYTLAGIPMMVKLIDHKVKDACSIDAVFELKGQKPHDVVAGAFIAKKAGAILKYLDGKVISYSDLETALFQPSRPSLSYVLAATNELCDEIYPLLTSRYNSQQESA